MAGSPFMAFCQKKRPVANKSVTGATAGDNVTGGRVIMVDDVIDTGGSTIGAATKFLADGAAGVDVFATHAIFSDGAEERLICSPKTREFLGSRSRLTCSRVVIIINFLPAIFAPPCTATTLTLRRGRAPLLGSTKF
jgi:Phosphoribosyl synthetase-associated domain